MCMLTKNAMGKNVITLSNFIFRTLLPTHMNSHDRIKEQLDRLIQLLVLVVVLLGVLIVIQLEVGSMFDALVLFVTVAFILTAIVSVLTGWQIVEER